MGKALELITGFVTAPGTTQTNLVMAAGNSLTIRNASPGSKISLIQLWADVQVAGILRVRSPQMHDNVQGIRYRSVISEPDPLLPWGNLQPMTAQDTLQADLSGSGIAADIETACMLIAYDDLPGISGQFIDYSGVQSRIVNLVTVENSVTTTAVGGYTGEEAINADFDLLHANTDYAIMGYTVNIECAAVRYLSSDFGNLGVGGPGNDTDKFLTANWFSTLSRKSGMPLIPVFNSANASSVLISCATDENGAANPVIVNTVLAELQ